MRLSEGCRGFREPPTGRLRGVGSRPSASEAFSPANTSPRRHSLNPIGYVIAVSGAAGSGKSTIVRALAHSIPDSVVIHFDRYQVRMPDDLPAWLSNGADFNQWSAPQLAEDLAEARDGANPVVFEAPWVAVTRRPVATSTSWRS